MGRFIRSCVKFVVLVFTLGSVNIDKMSQKIAEDPAVLEARYRDAINKKRQVAKVVKNAIGDQMALQEQQKGKIEQLKREIVNLEKQVQGAKNLRDRRVAVLRKQGKVGDEIKNDLEIKQLIAAFKDASSTLAAKQANLKDLEEIVKSMETTIENYILQAQVLTDEIRDLERKCSEAVAALGLAKAMDGINEAVAGISTDGVAAELKELDDIVEKAKGRAKASARIARVEQTATSQALQNAAQDAVAESDFFDGVDLGEEKTASTETPATAADAPATESDTSDNSGGSVATLPEG